MAKYRFASRRGYLGIAREQSEATTHGTDYHSHESKTLLARNVGILTLGAANRIANASAMTMAGGATFNLNTLRKLSAP
jgi:hypothetical protein